MATAHLKINNCLDCPHSEEFNDPGSSDSFDMGDTSIGCSLKVDSMRKDRWNTKGIRVISGSERPWRHRKNCQVPNWCPLIKK